MISPAGYAADEDVRISSIGYLPERSKTVSVTAEAERFTVRNAADDSVVFEAELPELDAGHQTKVAASIGDFSSVTTPGIYYVEVPDVGRSHPFPIAPDVYDAPFKHAMLGFYGWRSGIDISLTHGGVTFSHGAGHLDDAYIDYILDGVAFATARDFVIEGESAGADDAGPASVAGDTPDAGPDAAAHPMDGVSAVDGTCACRAVGHTPFPQRLFALVLKILFQ